MEQTINPSLKISVDNNIIYLTLGGAITKDYINEFKAWTAKIHQTVLDLHKKTGEKVKFLTDVTALDSMDKKILDDFIELLKFNKPYVYKSATFGGKLNALILLTITSVYSDRADFQHFKNKEEAEKWLSAAGHPLE